MTVGTVGTRTAEPNWGYCWAVERCFEEHRNPNNMSSMKEADLKDSGEASTISLAEVSEGVNKLRYRWDLSRGAEGSGHCWLTQHWTMPVEWLTGVVVPFLKNWDRGSALNFRVPRSSVSARKVWDCRASNPGGAMQIPSWPWSSGPTLNPC